MRIIELHHAKQHGITPVIRIPGGRQVTLPAYCNAWCRVSAMQPNVEVKGWEWYPVSAGDILRELRRGMHDRINQHVPYYGKGRKWQLNWQIEMSRAAWQLNHPRLIIDWLPVDLRTRFAHRLRQPDE